MTERSGERPIMLSLISEQAIPNVMAALLVEPRPRTLMCLLPEDRERKGRVDREFEHVFNGIRDALARIDPTISVLNWASPQGGGQPIFAYDADQVRRACRAIRQDARFVGASWLYNVTGGTKIMAQAALDDARANGCRALYVDTDSRQLIWDGAGAVDFDEDGLRSIGVAEYLAAYGVEVKRYDDDLAGDLRQAARLLGRNPAGPSLMEKITDPSRMEEHMGCSKPAKNIPVILPFGPHDLTQSERELLVEIAKTLHQRDIDVREANGDLELELWTTDEELRSFFWGGRWLESYAFDTVCQLSQRDDGWHYNRSWRNVLIEWSGIRYSGLLDQGRPIDNLVRPANELDVAATRGGRLLVCECKTGANALDPDHLYKLHVIGHKLGTFADKVLITDRSNLLDRQNLSTRHRVVRALVLNVAVVQASELPVLSDILSDPDRELRNQKRTFELAA